MFQFFGVSCQIFLILATYIVYQVRPEEDDRRANGENGNACCPFLFRCLDEGTGKIVMPKDISAVICEESLFTQRLSIFYIPHDAHACVTSLGLHGRDGALVLTCRARLMRSCRCFAHADGS